jgi:glycerophosphoryl diester phosphodiesterase
MLLIAHRGGTDRYPELTLEGSRHSLQAGADYVELDIRFTKDGVPVIAHDSDSLRLFDHPARIADMTAEQFTSLHYAADNRLRPRTLDEVLAAGIAPVLFHVKEGGGLLIPILERIRDCGYENRAVMGVVAAEDVRMVKAFGQQIQVLGFIPSKEQENEFIEAGADMIRLWEEWVDELTVTRIRRAGCQVWVMAGLKGSTTGYTSKENVAKWKSMGVDGVLLDRVETNRALV